MQGGREQYCNLEAHTSMHNVNTDTATKRTEFNQEKAEQSSYNVTLPVGLQKHKIHEVDNILERAKESLGIKFYILSTTVDYGK